MRTPLLKPRSLAALLAVALGLLWSPLAAAAEVRRGESVELGADEVIDDDLYIFGGDVVVNGKVNGDLIVFARHVAIQGEVDGSLIGAAQRIRVEGRIRGTVRMAGQDVLIHAPVERDLLVAADLVTLSPGASVKGDLWVASSTAELNAPVAGEVRAASNRLTLSSEVGGDVDASAQVLTVAEGAQLRGGLRYRSAHEANIAPGARIDGAVVPRIEETERGSPALVVFFLGWMWIRAVIGLTALGLLVALISPRFAQLAPLTMRDAPARSVGWGALTFFAAPLAVALTMLVGALTGGWWIGLIALAVYAVALVLCLPLAGLFVGEAALRRFGARGSRLALALLLGVALLTLAGAIPLLGLGVLLLAVWLGLGGMILTGLRLRSTGPLTPEELARPVRRPSSGARLPTLTPRPAG